MTSERFRGLVVVVPRSGKAWRWVDFFVVVNKKNEEVRIERFEAPCRHCRELFDITVKIPRAIAKRYLERRLKGEDGEIRLNLPTARHYGNFGRVNCSQHLWSPAPQPELVPGAEGLL